MFHIQIFLFQIFNNFIFKIVPRYYDDFKFNFIPLNFFETVWNVKHLKKLI